MTDLTGAPWFTSSRSHGGKDCPESARLGEGHIGVRDSKNPAGPALVFTPVEWDALVAGAEAGVFDRL